MIALFLATLALYLYAATRGIRGGVEASPDVWRESQTLIGIWSILKGRGHEVPILGCTPDGDWRVPMEFPLCQYAAAGLHRLRHGVSIEKSARLTAIGFYLLAVGAAVVVGPAIGLPWWLLPSLMLLSPYYAYYSRTPSIETAALACNGWYLAAFALAAHQHSVAWFLAACGFAALAGMVKANSCPPFWIAGLAIGYVGFGWLGILAAVGAATVGAMAALAWLEAGDRIKRQNIIARTMLLSASPEQRRWNFGTWRQRLDPAGWAEFYARGRCITGVSPLLLCVVALSVHRPWIGLACVGLYYAAPLVFWNVHRVHPYYTAANGVFLLAALACWLAGTTPACRAAGLAVTVAWAAHAWWRQYRPVQLAPEPAGVATWRKSAEAYGVDDVLVLVGYEWNPVLAWILRRRALYLPDWQGVDQAAVTACITALCDNGYRVATVLCAHDNAASGVSGRWVFDEVGRVYGTHPVTVAA